MGITIMSIEQVLQQQTKHSAINQDLDERIAVLTKDIGQVLHANTSTLVMVQQTLDIAINALGPNPFGEANLPTFDEIDEVLASHTVMSNRSAAATRSGRREASGQGVGR